MELNLLFLPLLGGFVFYTRFNGTAYRAKRISGYALIFNAAAFGLIFLVIARAVVVLSPRLAASADTWVPRCIQLVPGVTVLAFASLSFLPTQLKELRAAVAKSGIGRLTMGATVLVELLVISTAVVVDTPLGSWLWPSAASFAGGLLVIRWMREMTRLSVAAIAFRVSAFSAGLALAVAAFAVHVAAIDGWWRDFSPYADTGTPFVACVLGATLWIPLNLLYPYTAAIEKLHATNRTNALDKFLHEAAADSSLVLVSLTDGKFYAGLLTWVPSTPEASGAYLRLLPYASGYREEETRKLIFTTYYDEVYADLRAQGAADLSPFIKVLPVSTILSTGRFDPRLYVRFNAQRQKSNPAEFPAAASGAGAG